MLYIESFTWNLQYPEYAHYHENLVCISCVHINLRIR